MISFTILKKLYLTNIVCRSSNDHFTIVFWRFLNCMIPTVYFTWRAMIYVIQNSAVADTSALPLPWTPAWPGEKIQLTGCDDWLVVRVVHSHNFLHGAQWISLKDGMDIPSPVTLNHSSASLLSLTSMHMLEVVWVKAPFLSVTSTPSSHALNAHLDLTSLTTDWLISKYYNCIINSKGRGRNKKNGVWHQVMD